MTKKRILGIKSSVASDAEAVGLSIGRLGAAQYMGSLGALVMESLAPTVKGGLVTESHVRRIANKLGASIPVQKFAGRAVADQAEANAFFLEIADQYGGTDWMGSYFLDTDFFRRPDGFYAMSVNPKGSNELKGKLRTNEYIEVALLADGEEKPRGVQYTLSVGEAVGAALDSKVKKLLNQIKNDINESERK